ncbi:MAG: chemotaxis protein CheX [Lachnospiraceae bacterium]|nr:chemotaxis protein CheX [Lachnospiraceae bacterium]
MVSSIIGTYLVEKNLITKEQLRDILYEQKKVRVKLGLIAVSEGLLDTADAEKINRAQARCDKRFGDIAIEMGLLTDEQIAQLLKKQGNAYMAFAQTLSDMELMNIDQLEQCLVDFKQENNFTNSEMDDIKSDDPDRILRLYLPPEAVDFAELCGVTLRTLIRFADTEVFPKKAVIVSELAADHAAMQTAQGDPSVYVAMAGKDGALLPLASLFGKDDFQTVNEDALDAVAEFVNCVNGLYASALSREGVELELLPPEYTDGILGITSQEMLYLPLVVGGREVIFAASFGYPLQFFRG